MVDHGEQSSRPKIVANVATFCLLSAALGFAAEATNLRLADVKDLTGRGCTYPRHPKSPTQELGFAAVVALLVSRVYCFTTRVSPSSSSPVTRLSLISSWVAWFGAMSFYVIGLVTIETQGKEIQYRKFQESYYVCKVVKPWIFGAGASFALTSFVLHIIYLRATNDHDEDMTIVRPSTQRSEVTMF